MLWSIHLFGEQSRNNAFRQHGLPTSSAVLSVAQPSAHYKTRMAVVVEQWLTANTSTTLKTRLLCFY